MFDIFGIFVGLFFLVIGSILIYTIIRNIRQWHRNNNSPVQTVPARIVAKRFDIQNHMQGGGENQMTTSHTQTNYFVTFELENRQRVEFRVKNKEYGLLVEGDIGMLTHRGTRYQGFIRNLNE